MIELEQPTWFPIHIRLINPPKYQNICQNYEIFLKTALKFNYLAESTLKTKFPIQIRLKTLIFLKTTNLNQHYEMLLNPASKFNHHAESTLKAWFPLQIRIKMFISHKLPSKLQNIGQMVLKPASKFKYLPESNLKTWVQFRHLINLA